MRKQNSKPKESDEFDEFGNKKRPPLLPTLTPEEYRLSEKNKDFLRKQQQHNNYDFALFPAGGRGENELLTAYGFWPHRFSKVIMFHEPEFQRKFQDAVELDPITKTYAGDWDFTLTKPRKIIDSQELERKYLELRANLKADASKRASRMDQGSTTISNIIIRSKASHRVDSRAQKGAI